MTEGIRRAGLIGAGRIAQLHAMGAQAAGVELRAVAASTPERSREAAARLGATRAAGSVAELVADPEIDVVHVASPTGLHAAHALQVIEAGKHLVCEKPLAATPAEAEALVAAARAAGVVGTVAFTYRFHPVVLEARERVRAGALGTLTSVRGQYLQDWLLSAGGDEWRLDSARGGPSRAWADIGSHLVDLVEFVTGDPLAWVAAGASRTVAAPSAASTSADDTVAASVSTASGALGALLVSQVAPGHFNSLSVELSGDRGALGVDLERTEALWVGSTDGGAEVSGDALADGVARAGFAPEGGMTDLVAGFVAFVRESYAVMGGGASDVVATLDDGLRALRVGDAVLEAARRRAWVAVAG